MKTRRSSVVQKMIVYVFIVLILGAAGAFAYLKTLKNYNAQVAAINAKKIEIQKQTDEKKREKSGLDKEIKDIENRLKELKEKNLKEKGEYNKVKSELEEKLSLLPPIYMKADVLRKLHQLAEELNIRITSGREIVLDKKMYDSVEFMPIVFNFVMEGKYQKLKEYLWYLDRPIALSDINDEDKYWNIIVNISEKNMTIMKSEEKLTEDDIIDEASGKSKRGAKPKAAPPPKTEDTPKTARKGATASPVDSGINIVDLNTFVRSKNTVLNPDDDSMRLDAKIVTYFRKSE